MYSSFIRIDTAHRVFVCPGKNISLTDFMSTRLLGGTRDRRRRRFAQLFNLMAIQPPVTTHHDAGQFVDRNFGEGIKLIVRGVVSRGSLRENKRLGDLWDHGAIRSQKPDLRHVRSAPFPPVFEEAHRHLHGIAGRLLAENRRPGPVQADALRADDFYLGEIHRYWLGAPAWARPAPTGGGGRKSGCRPHIYSTTSASIGCRKISQVGKSLVYSVRAGSRGLRDGKPPPRTAPGGAGMGERSQQRPVRSLAMGMLSSVS